MKPLFTLKHWLNHDKEIIVNDITWDTYNDGCNYGKKEENETIFSDPKDNERHSTYNKWVNRYLKIEYKYIDWTTYSKEKYLQIDYVKLIKDHDLMNTEYTKQLFKEEFLETADNRDIEYELVEHLINITNGLNCMDQDIAIIKWILTHQPAKPPKQVKEKPKTISLYPNQKQEQEQQ